VIAIQSENHHRETEFGEYRRENGKRHNSQVANEEAEAEEMPQRENHMHRKRNQIYKADNRTSVHRLTKSLARIANPTKKNRTGEMKGMSENVSKARQASLFMR
jgi:translation initiation factor IF-2